MTPAEIALSIIAAGMLIAIVCVVVSCVGYWNDPAEQSQRQRDDPTVRLAELRTIGECQRMNEGRGA